MATALVAVSFALPARAQTQLERATPALANIGQIVVAEPSLANAQASADCHLDPKAIQALVAKKLTDEQLPIVANGVGLERTDLLRITVRPEIATLKDGVVNCVSYVSLRAEVTGNFTLPPLPEKKPVTAMLWTRGGLILTPMIDHVAGINNAFTILSGAMVKQYRVDNPNAAAPVAADPMAGIKK